MNYEIVNEELQIASISLADLTLEQAHGMLSQWENGANIGSLTLFVDKNDVLVLNRDNKDYEAYLSLAESYLSGSDELRKQIKKDFWPTRAETLQVLEKCRFSRIVHKNIQFALKNNMSVSDREAVRVLLNSEHDFLFAAYIAFRLGVIKGKRVERAKRKRGTAV